MAGLQGLEAAHAGIHHQRLHIGRLRHAGEARHAGFVAHVQGLETQAGHGRFRRVARAADDLGAAGQQPLRQRQPDAAADAGDGHAQALQAREGSGLVHGGAS